MNIKPLHLIGVKVIGATQWGNCYMITPWLSLMGRHKNRDALSLSFPLNLFPLLTSWFPHIVPLSFPSCFPSAKPKPLFVNTPYTASTPRLPCLRLLSQRNHRVPALPPCRNYDKPLFPASCVLSNPVLAWYFKKRSYLWPMFDASFSPSPALAAFLMPPPYAALSAPLPASNCI